MSNLFYERVKPLDRLKDIEKPTLDNVKKLQTFMNSNINRKYFFHDLDNSAWIPLLYENDVLTQVPDIIKRQDGMVQLPNWYVGNYLLKYASHYPDIIIKTANRITTENARAYSIILKALSKLSPQKAKKSLSSVKNWVTSPFIDHFVYDLKEYINVLLDGNYYFMALSVIDLILDPQEVDPHSHENANKPRFIEVKPRFDEYWVKDIVYSTKPTLIANIPAEVTNLVEEKLRNVFSIETDISDKNESSSYWRKAIEDHEQNTSVYGYKDLLVNFLRDSLLRICEDNKELGHQILSRYLEDEYIIFQRLVFHTLSKYGQNYEKLLSKVFETRDILDSREAYHEIYRLLESQFEFFPDPLQKDVINWLFDGPKDKANIAEFVKKRNPDIPSTDLDERVKSICENWSLRRLWAIKNYLEGNSRIKFLSLLNEHQEPDHPSFLSWSTGARPVRYSPPIEKEDLFKNSCREIVAYLMEFEPESPAIKHSREGLADLLQAATFEKPEQLEDCSKHLIVNDIRMVYISHYMRGFREAIEEGKSFNYNPLLKLCDHVSKLEQDPFAGELARHEADLRIAQLETANLIESLLKSDILRKGNQEFELIRSILRNLLENPDPSKNKENEDDWDPATRSLNTVRGKAMHALIQYAKVIDKFSKEEAEANDRKHVPMLDKFAKRQLEKRLDRNNEECYAIHSVYGWYTPLFQYLDHDWVSSNIEKIYPEKNELLSYWLSAWDAYIGFNNLYKDVFALLKPQYKKAINLISKSENETLHFSRQKSLVEHLCYAYIYGLIDLKSGDQLLNSFFGNANDDLRGHVAFWLSKAFGELDLDRDHPVWKRMWKLWKARVNSSENDDRSYKNEISEYMRWIKNVPLSFEEIEPILQETIEYLEDGYHFRLVLDYLVLHCENNPYKTVLLFHRLLRRKGEAWFSIDDADAGKILRTAVKSEDDKAVNQAVLVINLLGEQGDFRWKKYLPV